MRTTTVASLACLAALPALLAAAGDAPAAPRQISGKLSKPGYTVIALSASDRAKSVRVPGHKFRLRLPASRVTLHLRAKNGRYAGPIVVRGGGRRVIVGVRTGAKLGRIKVRRGYARVARRPPRKWVDGSLRARARHGVPIGARRFGRVRSKRTHGGVPGDRDLDGIANAFDIDDNGNLRLDNFEPLARAGVAQADEQPGAPIYLESQLPQLQLSQTVNANVPGVTDADIDATLSTLGRLTLDALDDSAELDCRGLDYCSPGGTGRRAFFDDDNERFPPFPECCDADDDGFGTIGSGFFLMHGATSSEIRTGDVLIERVTNGGVETQFPGALQFVFSTVPALVSYSDTAGNSATVPYPVPPGSSGTPGNGFPVARGPNGDVVVTLKFWRPQRRPIPPETGDWIDIGHLTHTAGLSCVPDLPGDGCELKQCPPRAFTPKDPDLSRATLPDTQGGVLDSAADRPASPTNTFTYTLNLSECHRDSRGVGAPNKPIPWSPGQEREFFFMGTNLLDATWQIVYFELQ